MGRFPTGLKTGAKAPRIHYLAEKAVRLYAKNRVSRDCHLRQGSLGPEEFEESPFPAEKQRSLKAIQNISTGCLVEKCHALMWTA